MTSCTAGIRRPLAALDGTTADLLIRRVEDEYDAGTFSSMGGDSAATWIIDHLKYAIAHPDEYF
jgi:hypothetical protein